MSARRLSRAELHAAVRRQTADLKSLAGGLAPYSPDAKHREAAVPVDLPRPDAARAAADAKARAGQAAANLAGLLRVAEDFAADTLGCGGLDAGQMDALDGVQAVIAAARHYAGQVREYFDGPHGC